MISSAHYFKRLCWLLQYIEHRPGCTLKEIMAAWSREELSEFGHVTFHRCTFGRDIETISDVFAVQIECDPSTNTYRITNTDNFHEYNFRRWMLSSIHTHLLFSKCRMLSKRFLTERFPSENFKLTPITQAMQNNNKICITYAPYGKQPRKHIVEPYCIKTYRHRFYLLARFYNYSFYTFSLDRIKDIEILQDTFEMDPGFDAEEFFSSYYGVLLGKRDVRCTSVVVRAYDDARFYLRDVPLHRSQVEINRCASYSDFRLVLHPTQDFLGDIMQQCGRLEIIAPESLRDIMRANTERLYHQYHTDVSPYTCNIPLILQ